MRYLFLHDIVLDRFSQQATFQLTPLFWLVPLDLLLNHSYTFLRIRCPRILLRLMHSLYLHFSYLVPLSFFSFTATNHNYALLKGDDVQNPSKLLYGLKLRSTPDMVTLLFSALTQWSEYEGSHNWDTFILLLTVHRYRSPYIYTSSSLGPDCLKENPPFRNVSKVEMPSPGWDRPWVIG